MLPSPPPRLASWGRMGLNPHDMYFIFSTKVRLQVAGQSEARRHACCRGLHPAWPPGAAQSHGYRCTASGWRSDGGQTEG